MPDEPQRPVAPKGQADPDPSSEPRSSVATEPAEGQQAAPATRRRRRRRGGRGRGRSQSGSGPAAAPAEEATSEEPKATTGPKASPADEAPAAALDLTPAVGSVFVERLRRLLRRLVGRRS